MTTTLTATCWPFSLTDDPKAVLALSLAEDAVPETDPLIPALSPLAAIHARATYRELKAAVGARDQDAILAVLFRFRSGQPACAASVVQASGLTDVHAAGCTLHRRHLQPVRAA
jgi:hypothetical protein